MGPFRAFWGLKNRKIQGIIITSTNHLLIQKLDVIQNSETSRGAKTRFQGQPDLIILRP